MYPPRPHIHRDPLSCESFSAGPEKALVYRVRFPNLAGHPVELHTPHPPGSHTRPLYSHARRVGGARLSGQRPLR
eukprot:5743015-Pyramimonas_sp.AAC.1